MNGIHIVSETTDTSVRTTNTNGELEMRSFIHQLPPIYLSKASLPFIHGELHLLGSQLANASTPSTVQSNTTKAIDSSPATTTPYRNDIAISAANANDHSNDGRYYCHTMQAATHTTIHSIKLTSKWTRSSSATFNIYYSQCCDKYLSVILRIIYWMLCVVVGYGITSCCRADGWQWHPNSISKKCFVDAECLYVVHQRHILDADDLTCSILLATLECQMPLAHCIAFFLPFSVKFENDTHINNTILLLSFLTHNLECGKCQGIGYHQMAMKCAFIQLYSERITNRNRKK